MAATLVDLVQTSHAVRATRARKQKVAHLAALLGRLAPADVRLAALYLAGEIPQDALQIGWRTLAAAAEATPVVATPAQAVVLADVDAAFTRLSAIAGPGSAQRRQDELAALFRDMTADERDFVVRLVTGELRQGALRSLVVEALAITFGIAPDRLQRAVAFAGSFAGALVAWVGGGVAALMALQLRPLVPIEPMLAQPAADLAAALAPGLPVAVEWKLDGVRVQVHRAGDTVRVWSRQLRDVTGLVPDLVRIAAVLPSPRFVLDGEAVAFDARGRPMAFQDFMSLFSNEGKADAPAVVPAGATAAMPQIEARFFDILCLDDDVLIEAPYAARRARLERLVPAASRVHQETVADAAAAERVLAAALAAGHEGVMVKRLDAPYRPGRRDAAWLKVKPAATLDLVILAAEWGHGRRTGWLSNLHLGARVPEEPGHFAMLGKTFKGLTDAMLTELTADLQRLAVAREGHVVRVRPERVVEIAFDSVQRSSRYDSGLALRFARVKRLRPDKDAGQASTLDEVRRVASRA